MMRSIPTLLFLSCCWTFVLQIATAGTQAGAPRQVASSPYLIARSGGRWEAQGTSSQDASPVSDCVSVGAPENVACSQSGDASILLKWSPPQHDPNCDVVKYIVSSNTEVLWSTTVFRNYTEVNATDELIYDISNPVPYSNYSFEVWAETSDGVIGDAGLCDVVTREEVPSEPVNFRITAQTSNTLNLAWKEPERKNGIISNYHIRLLFDGEEVQNKDTQTVSITFGSIDPCTVYTATVAASTSVGSGNETTTVGATLFEEARNATCTQDETDLSLHVTWKPTDCTISIFNVSSVTNVLWSEEEFSNNTVLEGFETSYVIENPVPLSFYSFQVQAVTDDITIGNPMQCTIVTTQTAPDPPENLTLLGATTSSLSIQWEQPVKENGVVISYLVSWSPLGSGADGSAEVAARQHITEYRYFISDLDSATDYLVKVQASTGVLGEAAQDVFTTLTSEEDVPKGTSTTGAPTSPQTNTAEQDLQASPNDGTDSGQGSGQLSTGAIAGIAIGTLVGVTLLVAAAISCAKRNKIPVWVHPSPTGTSHLNLKSGALENLPFPVNNSMETPQNR